MKTLNVVIVCITAVICTALLTFGLRSFHHGCKRDRHHGGMHHEWKHHEGGGWRDREKDFNPEEAAEKKTNFLKEKLSLTEEQVGKIKTINIAYAEKKKALKEQGKTQIKTLHEENKKEIAAVLNKEQLSKLEQLKEDPHHRKNEK
jgi:hypothetical protein